VCVCYYFCLEVKSNKYCCAIVKLLDADRRSSVTHIEPKDLGVIFKSVVRKLGFLWRETCITQLVLALSVSNKAEYTIW
jgi:hypothetical protein